MQNQFESLTTGEKASLSSGLPEGLTVIVLSYERIVSLRHMLGSLLEQDLAGLPLEVIVCNNSPRIRLRTSRFSATGRLLGKFPDLRIINSSYNWKTNIRYSLATLAKYDTVLFLDDDVVLRNRSFITYMFENHRKLKPVDLLSCWNNLWVEWTEEYLQAVSLTFLNPQITELTQSDIAGPGICMYRKDILTPEVLKVVMGMEFPSADDMGFSLGAAMAHGSQSYYLPSSGMLDFHEQSQTAALYKHPGHYVALYAMYKALWKRGYQPVLSRLSPRELKTSPEGKAAEMLVPRKILW